ncbi:ABC transporter substrate-binding protein [Clostridium sp.]
MKKMLSMLMVLVMGASLMTGCGSAKKVTDDSSAPKAKVKMVIQLNGIDEDIKMQKAMEEIKKMDKYSNVDFEFNSRNADFLTAIPIAIAGGKQEDILIVANPVIQQQWADKGVIVPIDDIAKSIGLDVNKEFGTFVKNSTNNGKLNIVPLNITKWGLYYNKSVFDAAKVAYPDDKVPMTWDQYRELATKITSGSGANKKYGAFYLNWGTFWYGDAIMALGGGQNFYTKDGLSNIENPAFAKSMERTYNMMNVDGSMPTHANVVTAKTGPTAFMNGQYGMDIQGGWMLDWAADKKANPRDWKIGVAPMPVDSGTDMKTWGVVNGLGISPTSVDPKLALNIALDLNRLCAKYSTASSETANVTIPQDKLFSDFETPLADDGVKVDQLKYIFANPKTKFVGEKVMGPNNVLYEKVINEEVEKYFVKEQDLKTTIANIKKRGDNAILGK